MAASFQLELAQLISQEASRGVILSGTAGTDVSSLHNFLKVLSGYALYDSNDASYFSPHECFFIGDGAADNDTPRLMPPHLSPISHTSYYKEKAMRL